jgi:hypothetical protein
LVILANRLSSFRLKEGEAPTVSEAEAHTLQPLFDRHLPTALKILVERKIATVLCNSFFLIFIYNFFLLW